ncbi:MAG: SDR family NAD(P)-dependent oxidoreductase, partial [Desulfobacterales bacterium]|nr:SDR family NAD(P)-dependent oxidoreductase [Desulfobacterales bacterium]
MKPEHKRKELTVPVAIIGMGCFFPKSSGLIEYWRLISHGEDAITDVPETHWSIEDYYDEDPKKPDHICCKRGGFLSPVSFDPSEFGIPPSSLEATDTSQLLGLMAARMAFEDAGYGEGARPFDRVRTSVILGVTGTQELVIPLGARLGHPKWRKALLESGIAQDKTEEIVQRIADSYVSWQENSFPGLLGNVVAGRISNRLDLGGTNCVIDAACASSLSATHLGIQELISGRSDLIVTGGVDTLNDIFMHMCFAKTSVLSVTGDIRPFSKHADGTVLGEGVGIILLKRLEDAEADGDKIYSVIRSIGSSSDGRAQSVYAPRAEGQIKSLRMAYENAGISPDTVELLEAHGTGTRVGDQVEVQALKQLIGETDKSGKRCALGSVKSMIGHTKACAGTAGLIKTALSMYNKILPPTIKVEEPDPKLQLDDSFFYLNTRIRPWFSRKEHPRRAGVSAFGFGGSNFHVVLEEYQHAKPEISWDGSVEIAAFSADTNLQLKEKVRKWHDAVTSGLTFRELSARALNTRNDFSPLHPFRLLLVIERPADGATQMLSTLSATALERLGSQPQQGSWTAKNCFYAGGEIPGKLAFICSGQGSQYVEMGRDLVCCFPDAFHVMETVNDRFDSSIRLTDVIYPCPAGSQPKRDLQEQALRRTDRAQPAIGAVSAAMISVLSQFGIDPDAACGHSYGELTALYAAGWIDLNTFIDLSVTRGRLMAAAGKDPSAPNGGMLAVTASMDAISSLIDEAGLDVVLANRNSPNQGIVSGAEHGIDEADQLFRKNGFRTKKLPVAAAFHSSLVKEAQKPFKAFLETVQITPTDIPVISNTTGKPYPADSEKARSLLAEQILCPVDFIGNIRHLYETGVRTFVEVGPKTVLTHLVKSILADHDIQAIALDSSSGSRLGVADLARALCRMASMGYPVRLDQWERQLPGKRKQRMSIPISGTNYRSARAATKVSNTVINKAVDTVKPVDSGKMPPLEKVHQPDDRFIPPQPVSMGRPVVDPVNNTRAGIDYGSMDTHPLQKNPNTVADALRTVQAGLKSMQQLQTQTADAHKIFLATQSEATRTLQKMMESTRLFSEISMGLTLPADNVTEFSPLPPSCAAVTEPAPDMGAPRSSNMATRISLTPCDQGGVSSPSNRRVQEVPDIQKPVDLPPSETTRNEAEARAIAPETGSVSAVGAGQIRDTIVTVVSELTGYPEETLELDMDIEADLGIDSIKRVEILSTVEERLPGLPGISPEVMGSLKTLREIVDCLSRETGGGPAAETKKLPETGSAPAVDAGQIRDTIVTVVSELTGYPEETLELDMDIEADLGIDSIKRVEILSTVEERLPGLPGISPEVMGSLKTLREIVDCLSRETGGGPAAETKKLPETGSAPAVDAGQIRDTIVTVVSELTGYPEETLELDMDIEADLGIDSIKRVEILSTVEERLPGLPGISPEVMGSLKTLAQIIGYLSKPGHRNLNSSQVDLQKETAAGQPAESIIERKRVVIVKASRETSQTLRLPANRIVWVTDDSTGLSQAIVDRLMSLGMDAAVISPDLFRADAKRQPAAGLILVAPNNTGGTGLYQADRLKDAFLLARQLAPELIESAKQSGAVLATITRLDGAFGFRAAGISDPMQGGLAGLSKTASIEWDTVRCLALDISPDWQENQEMAGAVVEELLNGSLTGAVEVGLTKDARCELELVSAAYPEGDIHLEAGDVVVVTGGARGVTAAAAIALARRVKPTLVLMGRSPEPMPEPAWLTCLEDFADIKKAILQHEFKGGKVAPAKIETFFKRHMANREIVRSIEMMKRDAADVRYCPVDIRDAEAVTSVLDRVRLDYGPVRAIIHGAGVLEDRLIVDKTPEQFDRVFFTKVDGLFNLLDATREDDLNYIVLFSSVAARMGNRGQVDYAMANEVLNKIAWKESAERPDCRVISINWGPWDGGMVSPSLKREFERNGIQLIPVAEGVECLLREMSA